MKYNYYCEKKECTFKDFKNSKADGLVVKLPQSDDIGSTIFVWEVSHGMGDNPDVKCPICGGKAAKYLGYNAGNFIFKGSYLFDKAGCRREMALHHLDGKDDDGKPLNPYEEHYESGEKDHIRAFIKRGGKPAPMISTEHERRKKLSEAKESYMRSVLDYIDKVTSEVEVHWS